MGLSLKSIGNAVGTAATGGAWSPDGKSGYAQGGTGMAGSFNNMFDTSAFTDAIPGVGDKAAQDRANKANLAESALNRDFQERMSNTAYQRAMSDMKKAGLNPILAYMQGGASAPSGSTATVSPASSSRLADMALQTTTGMSAARTQATAVQQQQAMNESSIKLNSATAAKAIADTEKIRLNNVRTKKYEPLDQAAGRISEKAGSAINKIMDMFQTSGKDHQDKWKKALENVKPLGPGPKNPFYKGKK